MNISMKGEIVSFLATDKVLLHGFLAKPKAKSDIAILHIHGLDSGFYRNDFVKALANAVPDQGYNFFSIELRGSYGLVGMKRKIKKEYERFMGGGALEKFEESIFDIEGAIKYLNRIGIKKIILEGHSSGCQKITYYQYVKKDPRVKALILISPMDDYNIQKRFLAQNYENAIKAAQIMIRENTDSFMPKEYSRGLRSAERFLSLATKTSLEGRLFNYDLNRLSELHAIKTPILAIFGSEDEGAVKPVKEYVKIIHNSVTSPRSSEVIIAGANHMYQSKEEKLSKEILKWVTRIKIK